METSDGALSEPPRVHLRLVHEPGASGTARTAVRRLLAGWRTTDELSHDAVLVAHELVSNAVKHGRPEADGRISFSCEVVEDELVVVVADGGHQGRVAVRDLDEKAAHGRGLAIVDALSSSWTVDRSQGAVVRVVLPLR